MAIVYESTSVDFQTGEVISTRRVVSKKTNERLGLYRTTDGIEWLRDLSGNEIKIMIFLNENRNRDNGYSCFTPLIKEELKEFLRIENRQLNRCIKSLIEKGFLKRLSEADLFLNPATFYKGSSRDNLPKLIKSYKSY